MQMSELIQQAQKFAVDNGLVISLPRARKLAVAVKKRMDAEDQRLFIGWFETSEDYRSTSHSDRTGEAAVNNILKELLLSGTPA